MGPSREGTAHGSTISAPTAVAFTGLIPSSPGDGGLSFFGIVFDDARIGRVKITTGDFKPGPDDGGKDMVMMEDFIYGEPQVLP